MAKRKDQDPTEELENYLTSDSDIEIYDDLANGENAGLFNPLEFFRLLYSQFEFAKANKKRPLTVVENLKKLKHTEKQKWFLLHHLHDLIQEDEDVCDDKQLDVCCTLIAKEQARLKLKLSNSEMVKTIKQRTAQDKIAAQENKFDKSKVRQHLQDLPDDKARVLYLDELKTEYEQEDSEFNRLNWSIGEVSFPKWCELEITKLERRIKLEGSGSKAISKEKRAKGGTQYQNLLALYYLFLYLRAEHNNTKKAKFASFLTGFSEESIRQQFSKLHLKKDDEDIAWKKDMKIVRDYFQELGLSEVVRQIDNDLDI